MNKNIVRAAAAGLLFGAVHAHAITIGLNPSAQSANQGDAVSVEVVVSGLGAGVAPSISTFDLDLSFDPSLLSYSGAVFGDPVLGDQLDLFGLGSIAIPTDRGGGVVNLFELSFDSPSDLDNLQAGAFTLVTVTFNSLAAGTSNLLLSLNTLGDAIGDPLNATLANGSITVNSTNGVPEPVTAGLLVLGLIGLGLRPRRRTRTLSEGQ
jgi:hypothetical protein